MPMSLKLWSSAERRRRTRVAEASRLSEDISNEFNSGAHGVPIQLNLMGVVEAGECRGSRKKQSRNYAYECHRGRRKSQGSSVR